MRQYDHSRNGPVVDRTRHHLKREFNFLGSSLSMLKNDVVPENKPIPVCRRFWFGFYCFGTHHIFQNVIILMFLQKWCTISQLHFSLKIAFSLRSCCIVMNFQRNIDLYIKQNRENSNSNWPRNGTDAAKPRCLIK